MLKSTRSDKTNNNNNNNKKADEFEINDSYTMAFFFKGKMVDLFCRVSTQVKKRRKKKEKKT